MQATAENIISFCKSRYGTEINEKTGAVNIFYLEGCTAGALTQNPDLIDQWNDTSLIISYNQAGQPVIVFNAEATSEPGLSATTSKQAQRLGGVFRIAIGWHKEKWIQGFHKSNRLHPALVQCAPINGHRDKNMDGKRTGDLFTDNVRGLNHHGTRDKIRPIRVGEFSYACLVRRMWGDHMAFMQLCSLDPGYIANKAFKYSSTVVDWSAFVKA